MTTFVYADGRIVEGDRAVIPVLDLSVLRGYGVFDFLRTYGRHPFRLRDHLQRFVASARVVDLTLPLSLDEVADVIRRLLMKVSYPEANIKVFLTGGESSDQYLPEGDGRFFALVYPVSPHSSTIYEEGIVLTKTIYQRPFPEAKTIHYFPAIVAIRKARSRGAEDVLFTDAEGAVLETGTANFFGIKGGRIITPDRRIISGITRKVVLELCEREALPVEVRPVAVGELAGFEGAFITSGSRGIVPVSRVDEKSYPVHPLARRLIALFAEYTRSIKDPFPDFAPIS
ncbi:MAG: aminotransferase class IV [Simkaniaceae bacterium]|nr:aminotransferase class IV [Simkaniaceae bacterium]